MAAFRTQLTDSGCVVLLCVLCCLGQVGLRGINGLYLFEIEHADGSTAKVVDHDTVLQEGDVLWFAGEAGHLWHCSLV